MLVMLLHCPLQFAAVEGQLGERDLALCTHTERTRESSRGSTFVSSLTATWIGILAFELANETGITQYHLKVTSETYNKLSWWGYQLYHTVTSLQLDTLLSS